MTSFALHHTHTRIMLVEMTAGLGYLRCMAILLAVSQTACNPECTREEDIAIAFNLSPSFEDAHGTAIFEGDVTITDVIVRTGQVDLDMSGTGFDGVERDMRLTLAATPAVHGPVQAGDVLRFQFLRDEPLPDWVNTFAGLWGGDDLVLGLLDQAIEVQGSYRVGQLTLEAKHGFCPKRSDGCGAHERIGIEISDAPDGSVLVMDHGSGILLGAPTYRVLVEKAAINYDNLFVPCPGRPHGWLRALIARDSP